MRKYVIKHPDLEGTGTCLESTLPVWLAKGFEVVEHPDDAPPAPGVHDPAVPLYVEIHGELRPANDAAREAAQSASEPDVTAPGASEVTTTKRSKANEETD